MEEDVPPPLPKRPTIIRGTSQSQSETTGPKTADDSINEAPSPRIPARPAPPKPGNRPLSIKVPSKEYPRNSPTEKSNVNTSSKRKIEITIVDARPMSEAGFRDMKTSVPKQPSPTRLSSSEAKPELSITGEENPKPSDPTSPRRKSPSPSSQSGDGISSPPASALEVNDNNNQPLPPRPKRPTIIRPSRPGKSEEETVEKTPFSSKEEIKQNINVPPLKPIRMSQANPIRTQDLESKSKVKEENTMEQPNPVTDLPVAPSRAKRSSIIRAKKTSVQENETQDNKEGNSNKPPSLPSQPSRPSPNVSPPPLPSRSPISHPATSTQTSTDSIKVSSSFTDNSALKRPTPKPRPRSMVISSSAMSLASSNGDKEILPVRSSSPPPLPVKAPRPASSFISSSFLTSPTMKNSSEKDNINALSHDAKEEEKKSQERSLPPRPKSAMSVISKKTSVPPRPSAPPARPSALPSRKQSDSLSHLEEDTGNIYEAIGDVKDEQSIDISSVKEVSNSKKVNIPSKMQSSLKSEIELKDVGKKEDEDSTPVYAKVNKAGKKPAEINASDDDNKKSNEFPFKVKLKSTLSPSEESKENTSNLEAKQSNMPTKENEHPPVLAPKPKPKPLLKPKPQPAVKPKPVPSLKESNNIKSDEDKLKPLSSSEKEKQDTAAVLNSNQDDRENLAQVSASVEKTESELTENKSDLIHILNEKEKEQIDSVISENEENTQRKDKKLEKSSEKPPPPLPSRRPVTIIGRPAARTNGDFSMPTENDKFKEGKTSVEENSISNNTDHPSNDKTSIGQVENDLPRGTDEGEPSQGTAENDPSSLPTKKKPVRIIGFPCRTSSAEKEKESELEIEKETSLAEEKSNLSKKPPRPAARPPPPSKAPSITSTEFSRSSIESGLNDKEENSYITSHDASTTHHVDKDKDGIVMEKHEEQSMQETEKETEKASEKSSPSSKHTPLPVARPPPPSKMPSGRESKSDADLKDTQKDTRTSISEESESVIEESNQNKNEEESSDQNRTKPPRKGLPPPRPPSAVYRKNSESGKDINQNDKLKESIKDKPLRPQPSRPLPPKTEKRKSVSGPPDLPPRPGPGHILYNYIASQPHGIALHDYTASQPDELSFQAGETIILTRQVDDQWLCGKVGNKEGIFPKAFLDLKCSLEFEECLSTSPSWQNSLDAWPAQDDEVLDATVEKPDNLTGPRCRARFDFEGCGEGELTLEDGDVIQLVSHVGTEWLKGELNGKQGIFPSAFVEIIEDISEDANMSENTDSKETIAIFDFEGQEGDLPFQAGDSIHVLSQINSEWLYGECNGKKGQFPVSFISSVPPCLPQFESISKETDADNTTIQSPVEISDQTVEISAPPEKIPQSIVATCIARHDYDNGAPGDLQFKSGDKIEIIEFIGEDWLSGRLNGEEGMFPKVFVEMDDEGLPESSGPKQKLGKVIHAFIGKDETELTFEEGSIIQLEDFVDENQEWRRGTFEGKTGMFPSDFVEPI